MSDAANDPDGDADQSLPRVVRHVQPLGPRVLVRVLRGPDRAESGLYLPQGVKDDHAVAVLAVVLEVARTMPTTAHSVLSGDDDHDDKPDLGTNVSGIPVGAHVLLEKSRGVPVPWDETLRVVEVRHILAVVETVGQDELQ